MTTEGVLETCDRCGKTVFKAKTGTQFNVIDGYCEESPIYETEPYWYHVRCYPVPADPNSSLEEHKHNYYKDKMICPSCNEELADILTKFWRIIEV